MDAILFESIEISHVQGYPKLYKAVVTMSEFDYAAYVPELAQMAETAGMGTQNIFSVGFNWAVMRYYYQRCIRKGDLVAQSGYRFNSDAYNKLLTGNRTTLIPMAFKSNEIKFFLANKEYLDQMLAARMELLSGRAKSVIDFQEDELKAMQKLAVLSKAVKEAAGSVEFQSALKDAQTNRDGKIRLRYQKNVFMNREVDCYSSKMTPGAIIDTGITVVDENGKQDGYFIMAP